MDRVVHFEIPVDDLDAAKRFYGDVFGWGLTDFADGQEYVLATTVEVGPDYRPTEPGAINGALMRRRDDAPAPVVVIDVGSVDAALARVEAAGGAVVRPRTEIPSLGYYAYARDPQGNVIGLWEAMTPP
ncbi:MAG TPA: VOC family protein [Miltoncostaeaceae bacterium]|nr:VOC family protein [Miltoncostaeaceae bacterium]